ncbi:Vacuolar protein-sorting-associated protein 36, partial [Coemansia aciculifera]
MAQCEMCGAELLAAEEALLLDCDNSAVSGSSAATLVKLSFRAGGASGFYTLLKEALSGRAWATAAEEAAGSTLPPEPPARQTGGGGISTILSTAQQSERARDATLRSAFADLDALTAQAKDIVGMAEHLATQLRGRSVEGGSEGGSEQAFRQYLLALGIDSPVTRDSAGAVFHSELARELCDYLEHYVAQCGGSVALVDAYCLYNRAREFTPVYPEDFVQACHCFADLRLPLHLREYPSGLLALEDAASADDEAVLARIDSYMASFGPLTASDLAAIDDCSLALAEERLWLAERHARVCRDEA